MVKFSFFVAVLWLTLYVTGVIRSFVKAYRKTTGKTAKPKKQKGLKIGDIKMGEDTFYIMLKQTKLI